MNSELKQKKLFFKAREYMDKLKKSEVDICVVGNGEIAWVGILNFVQEH